MRWATLLLLIVALILISSATLLGAFCKGDGLTVVATIAPLGSIAREIGGEKVRVIVLVPSNSDPHQYAPKPAEAELVRTCDLFICIGKEPFLGQFPEERLGSTIGWTDWINAGVYIPRENPHYLWMYPENAKIVARVIANKLSSLDPENSGYYLKNLEVFEEEINSLEEWIKKLRKQNDVEGEKVLLGGAHFEPISEILRLNVLGVIIKGEGKLPSPSEVIEIERAAVEGGVKVIIVLATQREGDEGRIAEQISRETGIPIIFVHGVAIDEQDTYVEFMKYTISQIVAGIQAGRTAGGGESGSVGSFWTAIVVLALLVIFQSLLLARCFRWRS
ncbi:MAG: hypothetical protein DRO05_00795 [Thermoproteota archaeon]|nr:MAG: hypothetical protein DRO05_00795 [Candidatus Korarchaeota archaeon]